MTRNPNPAGNYHYLDGIDPYSAGVVADPGYEIVHVSVLDMPPWRDGFAQIDRHLASADRPVAALCAIELRSPEPFSFDGFSQFNSDYRSELAKRSLLLGEDNPVARTNVAPNRDPPAQPLLYGFAYTRACDHSQRTFIVAGAGDVRRQELDSEEIVRAGETSADAMREKAAHVMSIMCERVVGLGVSWAGATHVNVYTVQAFRAAARDALYAHMGSATSRGLHWHDSRPPIAGLEFEMDLRGTRTELALPL